MIERFSRYVKSTWRRSDLDLISYKAADMTGNLVNYCVLCNDNANGGCMDCT